MGNLYPPPPQIKDGKMARFGFIFDLGGGGGLLFHFIPFKIAETTSQGAIYLRLLPWHYNDIQYQNNIVYY